MPATLIIRGSHPPDSPKPVSAALYSPLHLPNATRLLPLHPGGEGIPICASLDEVSLDSELQYECLSYTWGDRLETETILINSQPVSIRRNLFEALMRTRRPEDPRTLWIDALSISQEDLDEKAQQVDMIGPIFRKASRVLAWLGEHADGSKTIFNSSVPTQQLAEDVTSTLNTWTKFFKRPYWFRTWIVQELVVADSALLQCGPDTIDLDSLKERLPNDQLLPFGSAPVQSYRMSSQSFERLRWVRRSHRLSYIPSDMQASMFSMTSFMKTKCYDRRDKIYALRYVELNNAVRKSIKVDYTISVVALFVRVVKAAASLGHQEAYPITWT